MPRCLFRSLMLDEDVKLVSPKVNLHFPAFEAPFPKRHKVSPVNHPNKNQRVSTNLFEKFEEMSHKNGSTKHKLEEEDSNFNYFEENYGKLVSESSSGSDNNDASEGRIVNIVSPSTNIFLSPKKKSNRKSIVSPISSTDEYYESTNKELLKVCKILYHYNHVGGEFPEEVSISSKYQIIGDIDRGSFSAVYKVKDKHFPDKQYALKKFNKPFMSFNERRVMLHEVQMMAKPFLHPHDGKKHVVRCFLAWQEDSYVHMLMELSPNGSLKDLIEKCSVEGIRIPDKTLWRIVSDLASGLQCIHSSGVVHLDIKPSNVLISNDGTLKIGDFGLAVPVGSSDFDREGDCRYMARELLNESARLPSADIFSLGITLYELSLVCDPVVPPLQVPGEGTLWHTLRSGQYAVPTGRPAGFVQLLHSTMAPTAEHRMSAQDILRGLSSEVTSENVRDDSLLLSVKPRRSVEYTVQMNRSPSFDALNMAI